MNYDALTQKQKTLNHFRPFPKDLVKNLEEWFKVELTYTSNAIEGNTLTRLETAIVIEKGITVGGKTLKEHLEATNHAHALDHIHLLLNKKPKDLRSQDILDIHALILKGIDDADAGHYRSVAVRISGSTVILPNPQKVPDLIEDFLQWVTTEKSAHPIWFAGEAHYRLVTIHPFADGNGRTARLLMNLLLMMHGYPPAVIRKRDRLAYITSLEKAQLGGPKEAYEQIIFKAVNRSLDIYLKALHDQSSVEISNDLHLLKIGELAYKTGESISTLRHWTKEGLLEVASITPSGYQLFTQTMIERCKKIKNLKKQRLTLTEIRQKVAPEFEI